MKKIKLNQGKLLGFKTLPQTPKIGGKGPPMMGTGITSREKIGGKLGAKVGGKGPPPP